MGFSKRSSGSGTSAASGCSSWGCGHGMAGVVLARRGAEVTAYEIFRVATCAKRKRGPAPMASVSSACQADAQRTPFANATFDAVWGHARLHHLDVATGVRVTSASFEAGRRKRRSLRAMGRKSRPPGGSTVLWHTAASTKPPDEARAAPSKGPVNDPKLFSLGRRAGFSIVWDVAAGGAALRKTARLARPRRRAALWPLAQLAAIRPLCGAHFTPLVAALSVAQSNLRVFRSNDSLRCMSGTRGRLMSIDKSLRRKNRLRRSRSVLTPRRADRDTSGNRTLEGWPQPMACRKSTSRRRP